MEFHGGQVWCWWADMSWIIYKISYCSESCPMSLYFLRYNIIDCSHVGWIYVLWFVLVEYELYSVYSWMFSHTWDRRTNSLQIEFVHTGASILTRSLYPNIFQWFCSWCGLLVVPLWLYLFWGICKKGIMCLRVLSFFYIVHLKHIGCSFECCHMVDSLGAWPGVILVWPVSIHFDVIYLHFSTSGVTLGCSFGVSNFFFNPHFWQFIIFWCNHYILASDW